MKYEGGDPVLQANPRLRLIVNSNGPRKTGERREKKMSGYVAARQQVYEVPEEEQYSSTLAEPLPWMCGAGYPSVKYRNTPQMYGAIPARTAVRKRATSADRFVSNIHAPLAETLKCDQLYLAQVSHVPYCCVVWGHVTTVEQS